MILNKEVSWYISTLLMIPLLIITYKIVDYYTFYAFGIIITLYLAFYTVFFYLRRDYIFYIKTVLTFYTLSILGAFLIAYLNEPWPILLIILFSWISLTYTAKKTKESRYIEAKIKEEQAHVTGFSKILASKTQQNENKKHLIDFAIELAFLIVCLYIYNIFS